MLVSVQNAYNFLKKDAQHGKGHVLKHHRKDVFEVKSRVEVAAEVSVWAEIQRKWRKKKKCYQVFEHVDELEKYNANRNLQMMGGMNIC